MSDNENATAEKSSTAIEGKQSQEIKLTDSVTERKLNFNGKTIEPIKTIDGKALLEKELPPIKFTIDKILPEGLFILAGSPKVGKSWLALDFCQAVTVGGEVWENSAAKGTALYLALEDNLNRLQARLKKYTDIGLPNLHFAIRALKISDGVIVQMADFIAQHPDTNLIIIDTMQHIRNNANDKNAYVSDYNDMNILRQITNRFGVSLVLVTHTRKTEDPDPLNIISGSTGLVGAVDGVLILEKDKRTGNSGRLTIANRDTEGHVFILEFDTTSCRWKFIDEETDSEEDEPLIIFINNLLTEKNFWSGTATELCDKFSESYSKKYVPATITKKLKAGAEILKRDYGISCNFKTEKNTKLIKFFKKKDDGVAAE